MSWNKIKSIIDRKENMFMLIFLCVATIVALAVFFIVSINKFTAVSSDNEKLFLTMFFGIVFFAVGAFFMARRKLSPLTFFLVLLLTGLAIMVRLALLDGASKDYWNFLNPWVEALRGYPGVSGWKESIGDYNVPYLYILTLISKLSYSSLYLIKMVSIIFDFLLAFYVMKIVSLKVTSVTKQVFAFFVVLFIPTVVINSAFWAQCDSIFTCFAVASLYYGLAKRPNLCVIMAAIGFAFKLQIVFFLPVLIVLLFTRHIKIRNCLWFPAAFAITILPAIIAGRPLADTLGIYIRQTETYAELTQKAANVYTFISGADATLFSSAGVFFAGAVVIAMLFYLWKKREQLDTKSITLIAIVFVFLLPMILPRMHERYFYMADVFTLFIILYNKKLWYIPAGVILTSLVSYTPFLFDMEVNFIYFAVLQCVLFVLLAKYTFTVIENNKIKQTQNHSVHANS